MILGHKPNKDLQRTSMTAHTNLAAPEPAVLSTAVETGVSS